MFRLSKKSDYALMAMKHIAVHDAVNSMSAREIAGQFDIPLELMAKVLQRLTRRGLLISQKGTRGGYHLARPAEKISVGDVIQAIDGPVTVTGELRTVSLTPCTLSRFLSLLVIVIVNH